MKQTIELIPFSVIVRAVNGNVKAINAIISHYSGYIAKLAMQKYVDKEGCTQMHVDDSIRQQLETKLILSIMKFKL